MWKHQLDWGIETLRHCHHDICAEHPEDIVHEQAGQQNQTGHHVVQMQQFYTVDGERHAEQIVGDPVLLQQVPDADNGGNDETHHVMRRKIVVDKGLLLVALAFSETDVEWHVRYAGRHQRTNHRTQQMRQCQHFQKEEVAGEQQVDVVLWEQLEYDVQRE